MSFMSQVLSLVVMTYLRCQVERAKLPDRPKFVICKAKMDRNAKSFDKSALSFKVGSGGGHVA